MDQQKKTGAYPFEDDVQHLHHDLPCISCDYNLKTLPLSGTCPECGRQVSDSARKGVLVGPRDLLKRIGSGARILSFVPIIFYGGFALSAFFQVTSRRGSGYYPLLFILVAVVGFSLTIYGGYHVAAPVRAYKYWPFLPRIITRYGPGAITLCVLLMEYGAFRREIKLGFGISILGVWTIAASLMVGRIARLADDDIMRVHATFLVWLAATGTILSIGSGITYRLGLGNVTGLVMITGFVLQPLLLLVNSILLALLMNGLAQLVNKSLEFDP